jgi:hypothetical protein
VEYMSCVIDDLVAWDKLASAERPTSEADVDPVRSKILSSLKAELLNVAVLIAVVTSITNAAADEGAGKDAHPDVSVYEPQHSTFFDAACERVLTSELECSAELGRDLQAYLSRLNLALKASRALACHATPGSKSVDMAPACAADAWRRVCTALLQLNRTLGVQIGQAVDETVKGGGVIGLIERAEAGGSPCLDADGKVEIPGWAERRRDMRMDVNITTASRIAGIPQDVIVVDASAHGLGLKAQANAGDDIVVIVAPGQELVGVVTWAGHGRAGVRLAERIDPLQIFRPLIEAR